MLLLYVTNPLISKLVVTETFIILGTPLPQAFIAKTEMVPETADTEKFTRIWFVPSPEIIITPGGSDQTYE